MRKNTMQYRAYAMRAEIQDAGDGGFSGIAGVMGILDNYRSVFLPGCYSKGVLDAFVRDGHLMDGHKWGAGTSSWIGMPNSARSEGRNLLIDGSFYSDEDSQKARGKMKDRQTAGKTTALSVGFMPRWELVEYFDSGEKLLIYAKGYLDKAGRSADFDLIDPAIGEYKGFCWCIPEIERLIEVSVVCSPGTQGSQTTGTRSLDDFLREGPESGLDLGEHLRLVETAVAGLESRLISREGVREAEGRHPFSEERLPQIIALRDSLTSLLGRCSNPTQTEDLTVLDRRMDDLLFDMNLSGLVR